MNRTRKEISIFERSAAVVALLLLIASYVFNDRLVALEISLFDAHYLSGQGRFFLSVMVIVWFAKSFAREKVESDSSAKAISVAAAFFLAALIIAMLLIFFYVL